MDAARPYAAASPEFAAPDNDQPRHSTACAGWSINLGEPPAGPEHRLLSPGLVACAWRAIYAYQGVQRLGGNLVTPAQKTSSPDVAPGIGKSATTDRVY